MFVLVQEPQELFVFVQFNFPKQFLYNHVHSEQY